MSGDDESGRRQQGKPPVTAYQQALGLLVRRERSRSELARRLHERGADPDQIDAALDKLAGQGFQDDDRFAGAWARTRAAAGYGPQRIRMELGRHGISGEAQDRALASCEIDWADSARDLVARRYTGTALADPAARSKALGLLLRRGFDQGTAFAAIDSVRSRR